MGSWRVRTRTVMRAIGGCAATLLLLTTAACGSSGDSTSAAERSEIAVQASPKTAGFTTSAHGDTVAFASPVVWDQDGIDESWVGLYRAGDTNVTVLPDLPVNNPFVFPAIQVTNEAVLLLATECPKPDSAAAEEGASCGPGNSFAMSYDLTSKQWEPFTPPPLPDGQRLSIGLLGGAPTFGTLTGTGPGGSAELTAYTQGSGVSPWIELPTPPLADIADACITDQGLVAVETAQLNAAVQAGSKSFEQIQAEMRELKKLDDGNMYAALFDPATSTWEKSKVTANRMVGTVDCQEPGIIYGRGNTDLTVQPATGSATTFTATGEIGSNPSVVNAEGSLIATYWYDLSDPSVEQATASGDKASAPTQLEGVAYPSTSFSLDGDAYWAGISDDELKLYPIG